MKEELVGEGHFYCKDCETLSYLVYYNGVPIICPECGSTEMEYDDDD